MKPIPGEPVLLNKVETGRRNRRTIDGLIFATMAVMTTVAAVVAKSAPDEDEAVGEAVVTVLGWAVGLWRTVVAALFALVLLIVVEAVLRRRWLLVRDLVLALVILVPTGAVLGRIVGPDWWPVDDDLWSRWGFPEYRLAVVVAITMAVGPEVVAPVRKALGRLVALAAIGQLALAAALPSDVLAAVALGLVSATLVRLVFGSAAGVPPSDRVVESLRALGVDVGDLAVSTRQEVGSAAYAGHDSDGRPLHVRVLGRDAQDTQRLSRRWRLLAYRDPPRSAPIGRLEQVEHEALATVMAGQAGVRVPRVLMAALDANGDASLVTRREDQGLLETIEPEQVSDAILLDVWSQVAKLRAAGIAHGRLNAGQIVLDARSPVLTGFAATTLGAPQISLDIDVAELLVSLTVLVGPERALSAAVNGVGKEAVRGALPFLQRAALTPHTRDLARTHELALKELARDAAAAVVSEPVDLAPMHRIRLRDFVVTGAVAVAAYLLISQLAEIGFGTIADSLLDAEPAWLVLALLVAQVGFVPEAVSLRGAVVTPLPLLPCVALKSALKFVALTVPGSAGSVAATVRFVQRMGGSSAEAVASGAVDDVAEKLVQLILVLALLPFVDLSLDTADIHVAAPDQRLVVAILVAILVSMVVVWLVPAIHAKVVPPIREGLAALRTVLRSRSKRVELFGGNIAGEIVFAVTLSAVCQAYGVDLSLAQLLIVNVGASVLAGFIPVPGGVGAAEATITAGLVAFGVDQTTAFTIAVTHRLCTNYLPPLWGYLSLQWLLRKGYV